MNYKTFRNEKLIDRENDIRFLKDWFSYIPKEILWVYGPKSTGKTTIIEYVIENELFDDFSAFKSEKYNVKYINLRGKLIGSYTNFLHSFIFSDDIESQEEWNAEANLGVFKIAYKKYNDIKNKKADLFDAIIDEYKKSNKINILIIDEIQVLKDIYINGEKELIKEFLNFCVRLTKELHLAHVVILSSNTIFIDRIYNDAKLKLTSKFYKIDHLNKNTVVNWLSEEGFNQNEIDLIWDYLGGCVPRIQRMMRDYKTFPNLEEYLKNEAFLAYTEIIMFLNQGKFSKKQKTIFKNIVNDIICDNYFILTEDKEIYLEVISVCAEKEILFFDPMSLKVTGNNRLYEKAFKILLKPQIYTN